MHCYVSLGSKAISIASEVVSDGSETTFVTSNIVSLGSEAVLQGLIITKVTIILKIDRYFCENSFYKT